MILLRAQRTERVINQLKQQVGALEKQHSRSVSQAIRPIQGEVERLKVELGNTQRKFNELDGECNSFRAAERERARQRDELKAGLLDARAATVAAEGLIAVIDTILASALASRPLAFDELTDPGRAPDFDSGREGTAEPAPRWEAYDPGPPGFLSRASGVIGLAGGHERRLEDARASYLADCDRYRRRDALGELALAGRRRLYDAGVAEVRARADWYPRQDRRYRIACRSQQSDLIVELELPSATAIPVVRRYEYDEHLAVRRDVPRSHAEISAQYAGLIAGVALRTASEVMAATAERADTVRTVTVNGRATGNEAATGRDSRPHLTSGFRLGLSRLARGSVIYMKKCL